MKIQEWTSTHHSWVALITLPVYSLASFIAFKKQGYNFVEHLVLNAFSAGQRLLVHIATFPLLVIYNGTPTLVSIKGVLLIFDFALLFWIYSQFFNKLNKSKAFLLTLLSYLIFFIALAFIGIVISTLLTKH